MELSLFRDLKVNSENKYSNVLPSYVLDDGSVFFMEYNFYTQLINIKTQYMEHFNTIVNSIYEITRQNKRVYFVADFNHPLLDLDNVIYRDINDLLAFNKLSIDLKINPESEWKD